MEGVGGDEVMEAIFAGCVVVDVVRGCIWRRGGDMVGVPLYRWCIGWARVVDVDGAELVRMG